MNSHSLQKLLKEKGANPSKMSMDPVKAPIFNQYTKEADIGNFIKKKTADFKSKEVPLML